MTKKRPLYCPAWTPTPARDGRRFYCIQPEGHGGQHVSPTANADAIRHDLEWVIYGTSEGQEIVDLRDSLAAEKARADKVERENAALRKAVEAARLYADEQMMGCSSTLCKALAELDAGEGR